MIKIAKIFHVVAPLQAHGAYPTVRYPAELLASAGHVVYALDFPGHGESPGTRGLIRSPHDLTNDALALAQWATVRNNCIV